MFPLAQAAESQLADLKQAAAEAVGELAEERKRGVVKERKLMDRTHEASKLREQLNEAENAHQVRAGTGLMAASVWHGHKAAIQAVVCLMSAFCFLVIGHFSSMVLGNDLVFFWYDRSSCRSIDS